MWGTGSSGAVLATLIATNACGGTTTTGTAAEDFLNQLNWVELS
jgi:hypothetical protein